MTFWNNLDRNNKYFKFIEECRRKNYDGSERLHNHHIIPKSMFDRDSPEHQAYCENPDNLILLSVEDHIKAHELLYEIYQRQQDQGAVLLLSGRNAEAEVVWRRLGASASHEIQEEMGITMWNNGFQRQMAARSMARPDALEIRSRGGRTAGKNRHRGTAIQPHKRVVFSYEGREVLSFFNCDLGSDITESMHAFERHILGPLATGKPARATQLLNGQRGTLNGWTCRWLDDAPENHWTRRQTNTTTRSASND